MPQTTAAISSDPRDTELMDRFVGAYTRWQIEPLIEVLDPDIEWRPAIPMLLGGEATVYRTHAGVRRFFGEVNDAFSEIRIEFSEVVHADDRIVAVGEMRGWGKTSGAETVTPWGVRIELREGKCLRVQTYLDPDEALEDAGLAV